MVKFAAVDTDEVFKKLVDSMTKPITLFSEQEYYPYDMLKVNDGSYKLRMNVTGFGKSELDLTVDNGILNIKGAKVETEENPTCWPKLTSSKEFLKQLILEPTLKVGEATLKSGILEISLKKEKDANKKAPVNTSDS